MKNFLLIALCLLTVTTSAQVSVLDCGGWHESAYAVFTLGDYTDANVYAVPAVGDARLLDKELIRSYSDYHRVDALGLTAGTWQLRIVPLVDGQEVGEQGVLTPELLVTNYDRSGFAHHGRTAGVGAYNNDGTLKDNAIVLYVTRKSAKTLTQVINGAKQNPCVGLQDIIEGYQKGVETRPLVVRVIGTLTAADMDSLGSSEEGLQIKGRTAYSELNMTIEGVGNDATFKQLGMLIRNATSVEVRNLGFMRVMDDGVSMDTDNSHLWVHNCDFFYGKQGSGDHAKGDGSADTKAHSTHVTVSYNHFFDTGKTFLCGQGTENTDQYITYHHNWFDHSDSRHPRVRSMSVHVYNNYYDGNSKYGIGATMGASIFAEANYFRNTAKPMLISMQGTDTKMGTDETDAPTFSGEDGGIIKAFGNIMEGRYTYAPFNRTNYIHFDAYEVATAAEQVPSGVVCKQGGTSYNNFDTDSQVMYSYTADDASQVPTLVMAERGAGRMQHGDIQWTFPDSEDTNSQPITALSEMLNNYQQSVVSLLGGEDLNSIDPSSEPQPGQGGYECHFTGMKPSTTFYTIVGSYSNSKGVATVGEQVYNIALKMEGSTEITFTIEQPMTLYLVFADTETANCKVDGIKYTAATNTISIPLEAGTHTIKKGDSRNLFYINLYQTGTALPSVKTDKDDAYKVIENGVLYIIRDGMKFTAAGVRVQ